MNNDIDQTIIEDAVAAKFAYYPKDFGGENRPSAVLNGNILPNLIKFAQLREARTNAGSEADEYHRTYSKEDWVSDVILHICELSDRDSPDDFPDAMVVTGEELREAIARYAPPSTNQAVREAASVLEAIEQHARKPRSNYDKHQLHETIDILTVKASVALKTIRALLDGQSQSSQSSEWQEINTADFSDDLIWLFDGVDSIEGPRLLETDDYDRFPYWAPCTWPSTKFISQGDGT